MKRIDNFDEVQATTGDFAKPTAGGYVCKIVNVVDMPLNDEGKGDYLRIEFDIAEGEFKGYYREQFVKWGGTWIASFIRSYKEKALGMFKHFTNCVEESNARYLWDWNEAGLRGKLIGLVLGEEEYINASGETKVKLAVKEIKNIEDIRKGNFKIPNLKKVENANLGSATQFVPIANNSTDDLPF